MTHRKQKPRMLEESPLLEPGSLSTAAPADDLAARFEGLRRALVEERADMSRILAQLDALQSATVGAAPPPLAPNTETFMCAGNRGMGSPRLTTVQRAPAERHRRV